jgi:hypothetical protein
MRPNHYRRSTCSSLLRNLKKNSLYVVGCIFFCIIFIPLSLKSQPSGGPYGPIRLTFKLPQEVAKIYYVAPDGDPEAKGESLTKPTTLETAIERVVTNDAIIMRGGTYRTGNLELNQGIIIQPYADEQPVLKGTFVATEWRNLGNGLWTTSWSHLFPSKPADWWQRSREGKRTPLVRFNNDMVFVDGRMLQSVGWEGDINENSYCIDYDAGTVYIGFNPTNRLVEITAFDIGLKRITGECHGKQSDRKGPIIRGITFTQYAYRALEVEGTEPQGLADESTFGKDVTGTTFEHCTISFCSRVAAYLRGDHLTMRHCRVSDTSTEGIYLISSSDVLFEKNIFTRNNIERITGYFPAAVKIFNQCHRVICRDNLVIDHPYSNGIWYDVGNVDGQFINNRVEGVGTLDGPFSGKQPWPSDNGFFFEISKGAICAGNVFVNCDHGIFVLNSSNVQMYQNTFVNSNVCIGRNERVAAGDLFGWHASTGPDIDKRDGHVFVNNLLTGDKNFHRPLLFVWQPPSLCEKLNQPLMKQFDYNVFVRGSTNASEPLILWSPASNDECQLSFGSLQDMQSLHSQFAAHSRYFADYDGPLFKSPDLGDYQLMQKFSGSQTAAILPNEIMKLLGIQKKNARIIGAYPSLVEY